MNKHCLPTRIVKVDVLVFFSETLVRREFYFLATAVNESSRTALESALHCDYIVLRKQINFRAVVIRSERSSCF